MTQNEKKDQIHEDAMKAVWMNRRAGVGLTMGGGKTLFGMRHMKRYLNEIRPDARYLLVYPKKKVWKTWQEEAQKFGMEDVLAHIKGHTTYLSLTKQKQEDYDFLIMDEVHNLKAKHNDWLCGFKGSMLGLTGTPPDRPSSEKARMVAAFTPILYSYGTDEGVDEGILNDYRIVVHSLSLGEKKDFVQEKADGGTWTTSEKKQYDWISEKIEEEPDNENLKIIRMKLMMEFPSKEHYAAELLRFELAERRTMVFCNTTDQADRLCTNTYHSNNKESEWNFIAFCAGAFYHIACVQQLSESVNAPNVDTGVILHAYSNNVRSAQRIGRALRLSPEKIATVHILMYKNTVDEDWVRNALKHFNQTKIHYRDVCSQK